MPFGISESAIKGAYGPMDLSGIYKSIDAASKRYDAETKLEKQALQKEYYTNIGAINRNLPGIRDKDSADVLMHYNKYKIAQQKLIANPRLIDNNPEEYGKLNDEANASYGAAMELITASKKKKDYLTKLVDTARSPSASKRLKSNALTDIANFDNMTTKQLNETNVDDLDRLMYQGPDLSKFTKDLDKIGKESKRDVKIKTGTYADFGATIYDLSEITNPFEYSAKISNYIALQPESNKFADSLMERFAPQVDNIASKWDQLGDDFFEQFKDVKGNDMFPIHPTKNGNVRKPDLTFDSGNSAADAVAFLTAQNILSDVPKVKKSGQTDFAEGNEIGKKKMVQAFALETANILEDMRQKNRLELQQNGYINQVNLMQKDKRLENNYKMLSGLLGKQIGFDIQNYTRLTPEKLNEAIGQLRDLSGEVEKSVSNKKGKNTPKKGGFDWGQ